MLEGFSTSRLRGFSLANYRILIEFYMDYVRHSRTPPIKGKVINSYVTHVAEFLIGQGFVEKGADIRSTSSAQMISGYNREDDVDNPQRTVAAIPLTYAIFCESIKTARLLLADTPITLRCVSAALALGYAGSLRTAEYLLTSNTTELRQQCNSSQSFFWWGDVSINVCDTHLYLLGIPDHFTTFLDSRKNGPGAKSIARCSSADIDCLTLLYDCIKNDPPTPSSPLLSGTKGEQIIVAQIQRILDKVADKFGFDRSRMRPHASIRAGVLAQLELHDEATRLGTGGWNSVSGMRAYQKVSLQHASRIASDIHDASLCPIAVTQLIYNTPAI